MLSPGRKPLQGRQEVYAAPRVVGPRPPRLPRPLRRLDCGATDQEAAESFTKCAECQVRAHLCTSAAHGLPLTGARLQMKLKSTSEAANCYLEAARAFQRVDPPCKSCTSPDRALEWRRGRSAAAADLPPAFPAPQLPSPTTRRQSLSTRRWVASPRRPRCVTAVDGWRGGRRPPEDACRACAAREDHRRDV